MTEASERAPLNGVLVIDICQFLSGPYASLRLQDLGARVIKVERPDGGDLCRQLYLSDTTISGDSTIFHAINRSKESLSLDLKSDRDLDSLKILLTKAACLCKSFDLGSSNGFNSAYKSVKRINPRIVYASISGYGEEGPWVGQQVRIFWLRRGRA